jgi:hypothetical protein
MGSLRQPRHNDLFKLLLAVAICAGLNSCVPATSSHQLEFFFSENVWGGSPFSEAQKKQVFVTALKKQGRESLSQIIPFEVSDPSITISKFIAIYEVDARAGLPEIKSGYRLELKSSTELPERILLSDKLSGVAWTINLNELPTPAAKLEH